MRVILDSIEHTLTEEQDGVRRVMPLYSREAFESLSRQWLKVGWDQKHTYTFAWMGRPIIQLPEDVARSLNAVRWATEDDCERT